MMSVCHEPKININKSLWNCGLVYIQMYNNKNTWDCDEYSRPSKTTLSVVFLLHA